VTTNPPVERLSFSEADARLGGALSATFEGGYKTVALFDGDLTVDTLDAAGCELIAVAGDLTVRGPIELYEYHPGLYVGGYTRAETLEGGDCEIYIGDGSFTHLVYGYYNDGILQTGTVEVPWVIRSDHDMRVTAPGAFLVDNFGHDADAHFAGETIPAAFVPEVVDPQHDELKVGPFLEHLRAGSPVLRVGAPSAVAAELDLTARGLTAFPPAILTMPWLRRLTLDGNPLGALPTAVGSLEYLSLRDCGLSALPPSLDGLAGLAALDLRHNRLDRDARRRLCAALPRTRLDLRAQHVPGPPEPEALRTAHARRAAKDWDGALRDYAAASAASADDPLGAHYGRMWIHGHLGYTLRPGDDDGARHRTEASAAAEACLLLVPAVWRTLHHTDETEFQREVVRYATTLLAREALQRGGDSLPTGIDLIERGAACADRPEHAYVHALHARLLLAAGRADEAWPVVRRLLTEDPSSSSANVKDLADDPRYRAWAAAAA
jgi:hypothetical protein